MKNKKLLLFLLILTTIHSFSQNEISIELTNATYIPKESKLTIDISIKNNTDSLVYIINPKKYFFYKHLDRNNSLNKSGLNRYPYTLDITPNKKCKVSDEGYESVMYGREIVPYNILKEITEIKPNETKIYKDIEINRFDGEFCSNRKYDIKISYNPKINFDKNHLNELKIKYDLIQEKTKELNDNLYYSLNSYRSSEKDNFKNLSELFTIIPKIESFNNKKIESNSILATEKK